MNNNKKNNKAASISGIGGGIITVITICIIANLLNYSNIMPKQYIGIIITISYIGTAMFFASTYVKIIPTSSISTNCIFCIFCIFTAFIINCCYAYVAQVLVLPFESLKDTQVIGYTIIGAVGLWIK